MALDPADRGSSASSDGSVHDRIEFLLFDSLVHHLIEKGLLTKNDALSIVQTVAEVVQGRVEETAGLDRSLAGALSTLERLYASFDAVRARASRVLDGDNVLSLRPPLHGDKPYFPKDDD